MYRGKKTAVAFVTAIVITVVIVRQMFLNADLSKYAEETILGKRQSLCDSSKGPVCIEDNICKEHPNDTIYIYRRKPDFIERIDNNISYVLNESTSEDFVPNIFHFIQYTDIAGGKTENNFEFHHMLSVLSAYKIQKPDRIYFWLDQEPKSKYWLRLKKKVPMYLIKRERPSYIRGRKFHFIEKISDVMRLEIEIEYGGIYLDMDVLVVKSLEPLRRYELTMGKEASTQLCSGVIIAKPWANLLRIWHQKYKTFNENEWAHHAGKVPYLLSREYPSLVHILDSALFRPAYYEIKYIAEEGNLYDWRKNNYVLHLWIRKWKDRKTDAEIDRWNTTAGEVYRYILYDDWRLTPI